MILTEAEHLQLIDFLSNVSILYLNDIDINFVYTYRQMIRQYLIPIVRTEYIDLIDIYNQILITS